MKPISGKLQSGTDSYSFVKRKSQNEDQNVQAFAREVPDCGQKMFTSPIGDMTRFSGKKENQSISVMNNLFSTSFNP